MSGISERDDTPLAGSLRSPPEPGLTFRGILLAATAPFYALFSDRKFRNTTTGFHLTNAFACSWDDSTEEGRLYSAKLRVDARKLKGMVYVPVVLKPHQAFFLAFAA